jgi:hypothetical protein
MTTTIGRDYASELRALLDAETSHGTYSSRQVAAHIVAKLTATDPELLDGWLHAQAEQFVWQAINDRDRSRRAHARHQARPAAFGKATEAHQAGDRAALTSFLTMPFAVADGLRKPLAAMTAPDLTYVADGYEQRAVENKMTAAFLRAVAKKVGDSTVADHFTEPDLARLWASLAG